MMGSDSGCQVLLCDDPSHCKARNDGPVPLFECSLSEQLMAHQGDKAAASRKQTASMAASKAQE